MSVPVVSLRSVVALIDQFPVLAGVDLDIDEAEVVLLRGANGAGKTSVLRVIAGLLGVTQGEVVVLGHDVARDRRAVRRRVGYFGHDALLYGELTAVENVSFLVRASGGSPDRITEALARVDLGGRLAGVPVDRMSAGQRRRVALAALLARDPELWLLDEPHTGLDAASRETLNATIDDATRRGRTVLFTSHEGDGVETLASRSVTIDGGVIASHVDLASGSTTSGEPTYVA